MAKPVLWHIEISHFNEKARWALDYKGVEHERRAPTPGAAHGGRPVADARPPQDLPGAPARRHRRSATRRRSSRRSSGASRTRRCIRRTPTSAAGRWSSRSSSTRSWARTLRLLAFHEATKDPAVVERFTVDLLPGRLADIGPVRAGATRFFSTFTGLRYGVKSDRRAELAKAKILAAFDRLESELGAGDYLVGDRFTVADLTAASLFYPAGAAAGGALASAVAGRDSSASARPLKERPGYQWVEEMFAKHRKPGRASDEVAVDTEVPAG